MIFILVPVSLAVLNWYALLRGLKRLDYLAKPGTILALLGWLWFFTSEQITRDAVPWILVGLICSLLGDVLLMLPKERFLGGLVGFFCAHLAYIVGLNLTPPPVNMVSLALLGLVLLAGSLTTRQIHAGLMRKKLKRLLLPVWAYSLAISLMLLSAWLTILRVDWPLSAALPISAGASSFYLSDLLLAWNRFVRPLPRARLIVRIPYHVGQIAIALGAALA